MTIFQITYHSKAKLKFKRSKDCEQGKQPFSLNNGLMFYIEWKKVYKGGAGVAPAPPLCQIGYFNNMSELSYA